MSIYNIRFIFIDLPQENMETINRFPPSNQVKNNVHQQINPMFNQMIKNYNKKENVNPRAGVHYR